MTELPILDEDYWTALEILAEETGSIRDCMAQGVPWYPADAGQFDWAMERYRTGTRMTEKLTCWSSRGLNPGRYFVPTEKEEVKIQWFVENFGGADEDPWVKEMVELAKAVMEEVH